jgi:hypothetical protein
MAAAYERSASALTSATDAAKAYNDQLHAMADPVFAMSKAVDDLADKQDALNNATAGRKSQEALSAQRQLVDAERSLHRVLREEKPDASAIADARRRVADAQTAYTKAVREHLPGSRAARQAEIDLAEASVGVTTAANTLSASLKTGATSVADWTLRLKMWRDQGIITAEQFHSISRQVEGVLDSAAKLDATHVRLHVDTNIADTRKDVQRLIDDLATLVGVFSEIDGKKFHHFSKPRGLGGLLDVPRHAAGGLIDGPGNGTSDSILGRLSKGEWIVKADGSNLTEAIAHYGLRGHQFTPTAQTVVHVVEKTVQVKHETHVGKIEANDTREFRRKLEHEERLARAVER